MMKRILFVLAAAALGFAGLYYRQANAKVAQAKADQIVGQDLSGADVKAPLADLRVYIAAHMGTSQTITLTGAFDRAMAAAKASEAATSDPGNIYADAQKACAGKSDSITQAKCNQAYLQSHLSATPAPTPLPEPKIASYVYNLRAPFWTPDLPGALLLGAVLALLFGLGGLLPRRRR